MIDELKSVFSDILKLEGLDDLSLSKWRVVTKFLISLFMYLMGHIVDCVVHWLFTSVL